MLRILKLYLNKKCHEANKPNTWPLLLYTAPVTESGFTGSFVKNAHEYSYDDKLRVSLSHYAYADYEHKTQTGNLKQRLNVENEKTNPGRRYRQVKGTRWNENISGQYDRIQ